MPAKIPLSYTPFDGEAIKKVIGQYENKSQEKIILDFESRLGAFTKAKQVVALNSGTAAIHLALKAVDVGPNDEVLVSTFTYVATVNPILYVGAKPIFIDIEDRSWNMDPSLLEKAILARAKKGKMPKAILVVHNYGMPADMVEIMDIANRYEIPVMEDAAEALGSRIGNKYVGTFGKVGILSFNNNKILTTYGGGAVLTEDAELAQKIMFWAGQSRESKLYYEHKELGYNYKMGPINAAVGLSKIQNLEKEIEQRRNSFEMYKGLLSEHGFQFQAEKPGAYSNRWLAAATLNSHTEVSVLTKALDSQGIETRRVWNPMHRQPLFSGFDYFTYKKISETLFAKSICLPYQVGGEKVVASEIIKLLGYK